MSSRLLQTRLSDVQLKLFNAPNSNFYRTFQHLRRDLSPLKTVSEATKTQIDHPSVNQLVPHPDQSLKLENKLFLGSQIW